MNILADQVIIQTAYAVPINDLHERGVFPTMTIERRYFDDADLPVIAGIVASKYARVSRPGVTLTLHLQCGRDTWHQRYIVTGDAHATPITDGALTPNERH